LPGGTWVTQNKVRSGVYIDFVSEGAPVGAVGERGIMTMALSLGWGPSKQLITVESGADVSVLLGYDITAASLLLLKEALKRASTVLLYRLNTGTKAAVTTGTLTATAKYGGVLGNSLTIVVQVNVDDEDLFDVKTLLSGVEKDSQTVANVAGLVANDWVVFSGTSTLAATAGAPLIGGLDGSIVNADHTDYMAAVELLDFNTIAYTGTATDLKALYVAFIKRLRDDEGKKVQLVVENYTTADSEGVISVKNGVKLSDGTTLTAAQATAWVAAATAAAEMNESLTYDAYDDAVDVGTRYTNTQIITAINNGELLFTPSQGKVKVELDINSFTSYTPKKGKNFSDNRVIRVLDGVNTDIKRIFESFYIGSIDNNEDGRNLFKNEVNNYMNTLQGINAIQNFDSQTDVVVLEGVESDGVYAEVGLQPVRSMQKLYMKVRVK
jgi:hypothetical protein